MMSIAVNQRCLFCGETILPYGRANGGQRKLCDINCIQNQKNVGYRLRAVENSELEFAKEFVYTCKKFLEMGISGKQINRLIKLFKKKKLTTQKIKEITTSEEIDAVIETVSPKKKKELIA